LTEHLTPSSRADFRFWWPVTVRWGDMDAMGHVNNIIYFQYLESARIAYFEMCMGWTGRDEGGGRQGPVVVSQAFNYRRQVYYPAELEVGVRCREIRNRSFVLEYGIFRKGTDELVGDGSSVRSGWITSRTRQYRSRRSSGRPSRRTEERSAVCGFGST
jgi:acyl-CoA thioester hydrolase